MVDITKQGILHCTPSEGYSLASIVKDNSTVINENLIGSNNTTTNQGTYVPIIGMFTSTTTTNTTDGIVQLQFRDTSKTYSHPFSTSVLGYHSASFVMPANLEYGRIKFNGNKIDSSLIFSTDLLNSFVPGDTYTISFYVVKFSSDGAGNGGIITNIKLERGNVGTPFCPSVYDGGNQAGKNLLRDSNNIRLAGSDYAANSTREVGKITILNSGVSWNAYQWLYINTTSLTYNWLYPDSINFFVEQDITLSMDIRVTGDTRTDSTCSVGIDTRAGNYVVKCSGRTVLPMTGNWERISATMHYTPPASGSPTDRMLLSFGVNGAVTNVKAGVVIEYKNVKLEYGDMATPWVPHVTDSIYTQYGFNSLPLIHDQLRGNEFYEI